MKPLKLTSIFGAILTVGLFLILWLMDYSAIGIPDKIPGTNYQIYAIAMFIVTVITLLVYQKLIWRGNPSASILHLTCWSFLVAFISQLVYQLVRQVWILRFESNDKIKDLVISMVALFFLMLLISLSIALELKKEKPILKVLSMAMFVGIIMLLKEYLGNITW
jgi:magnesium-transporting ATPase (P-type)